MNLKLKKSIYVEKFKSLTFENIIFSALAVLVFIYFHENSLTTIQKVESLMEKFRTIEKSGIPYSMKWICINIRIESSGTVEKRTFVHIHYFFKHLSFSTQIWLTAHQVNQHKLKTLQFKQLKNMNVFFQLLMVGKIMLLCTPVHCLLCSKFSKH